jgi:hypothetical protein
MQARRDVNVFPHGVEARFVQIDLGNLNNTLAR